MTHSRPSFLRAARLGAGAIALALLAGCSILSDKPKDPTTLYAPDPRVQADPTWPSANWQLSISTPTAARMIDTLRIAVRPDGNELQVYKGATWAKLPSGMIEDALLRALEDSNKIAAVARQGSGIGADYKLVLDLRRFDSDYQHGDASPPSATIELNAKLIHSPEQKIVATRTFLQTQQASGTEVASVVNAFEQSLTTLTHDLAGWVLVSGDANEKAAAVTATRKR